MLVRFVHMTFQPEHVPAFLDLFHRTAERIRAFPGCTSLELLQDLSDPTRFATDSHWESAEALDAYRESELFKTTWAATKVLFADKPRATSHRRVWPA